MNLVYIRRIAQKLNLGLARVFATECSRGVLNLRIIQSVKVPNFWNAPVAEKNDTRN